VLDPRGIPDVYPEEVALQSFSDTNGGTWTAFHLESEYKNNTATSSQDRRSYDITHHEIEGTIRGARMIVKDTLTLKALTPKLRVLPLELYRTLRVSSVRDEQGHELAFIQEPKDDDANFGVILTQELNAGQQQKLTVQYEGDEALRDSGGGNFILVPRSSWYPNNAQLQFGDRATFTMTFQYPRGNIFIGTGAMVGAEQEEGDLRLAKWSSGDTELGRSLYPKAPDMRLPDTQSLTDGELFYIIHNGVRFTGMPAFGEETSGKPDLDSWKLVHFIRHLPGITSEEVEKMKSMNPKSPHELQEEEEIRRFLEGDDSPPPASGHEHD
jgi:hypothetical protein